MKSKHGFSPAKLVIILAIIAGSVAAMTPITLNAIKQAGAAKVAEDIMALAEGIEKAVLTNGLFKADFHGTNVALICGSASEAEYWEDSISLAHFTRDIDESRYEAFYVARGEGIDVVIGVVSNADLELLRAIIPQVSDRSPVSYGRAFVWEGGEFFPVLGSDLDKPPNIWYSFSLEMD